MKRALLRCLFASLTPFALIGPMTPAHAARPFVTDDARLTTEGSCQMESWSRIYPHSKEIWALPACNPTGNFELTLGAGRARTDQQPHSTDQVFQAKTLFRPLETNDWGWGLAVGVIRHPSATPGPNRLGNTYAYLPASFSVADDKVIIHTNLGWLRDKESGRQSGTWGLGAEIRLTERLLGIVESFGDSRQEPFIQLGVRYSVIPDLFQIDATLGRQTNGPVDGRWLSFGVRYTPASLF